MLAVRLFVLPLHDLHADLPEIGVGGWCSFLGRMCYFAAGSFKSTSWDTADP